MAHTKVLPLTTRRLRRRRPRRWHDMSPMALRVQTIRDVFDALEASDLHDWLLELANADQLERVAAQLGVPVLVLRLIEESTVRPSPLNFPLIEELQTWMRREHVREDDIVGAVADDGGKEG